MKKRISLLMAAVLIVSLAACGQTQKPQETDASTEAPEATETAAENGKTLVVYYSWSTSGCSGGSLPCGLCAGVFLQ